MLSYLLKRLRSLGYLPSYVQDYKKFKQLSKQLSIFPLGKLFPIVTDKYEESATLSGFYFYQDLLVAQKIYRANPLKHVDIGSRIDGFVAHVASFREIELFDIRPLTHPITQVTFTQADIMDIDTSLHDYADSISSLSVLEHFGLWRYGDTLDPEGYLKWFESIYKILKPGGTFYFSVPIGPQRVEFNAHRVFSLDYLITYLQDKYSLVSFSYVDDAWNLHEDISLTDECIATNCGCQFGNGIFELIKK